MPQFDTFSFLSQLFWVFLIFSLFYTALAYYLLPAIAITLKIRRRKAFASQQLLETSATGLSANRSSTSTTAFISFIDTFFIKKSDTSIEPNQFSLLLASEKGFIKAVAKAYVIAHYSTKTTGLL